MLNCFIIFISKVLSIIFRGFKIGNGSTWPGHIALKLNKKFITQLLIPSRPKVVLVAGTNGKTTTAGLIGIGLDESGLKKLQNISGANLVNGIASSLILGASLKGRLNYDVLIFEVDENTLAKACEMLQPEFVVLLNLFRDQLDRYGEIESIARKWSYALENLPNNSILIANADDPRIAKLGMNFKAKTYYFGLSETNLSEKNAGQPTDASFCPKCEADLFYKTQEFSHLGDWYCKSCGLKRPKLDIDKFEYYPLHGQYNKYNALAAALTLEKMKINKQIIMNGFQKFTPAFGRQEELVRNSVRIKLFLSKNPTSFNQSFETIKKMGAKIVLFVLNDHIPDGRDVSWFWDSDLSDLERYDYILVSGERAYDMALRIKYANKSKILDKKLQVLEDLNEAIEKGINLTKKDGCLYIMPNYSAMLEVRQVLTGRKIL